MRDYRKTILPIPSEKDLSKLKDEVYLYYSSQAECAKALGTTRSNFGLIWMKKNITLYHALKKHIEEKRSKLKGAIK